MSALLLLGAAIIAAAVFVWRMSMRVARLVQQNHPDLHESFRELMQAREYVAANRVLKVGVPNRAKSDPALARALKLRRLAFGTVFVVLVPVALVLASLLSP